MGAAQGRDSTMIPFFTGKDWYSRCAASFLLVEDCAMHFQHVSPFPTVVFHRRGFGLVLSCGDDGVIKANG